MLGLVPIPSLSRGIALAAFALLAPTPVLTIAAPSPWVLIAQSSEIRIYIDSTRVLRHRPNADAVVWLRFIHTHPQPASLSPNGPRVKEIDVQVGLDCHTLRDHAYYVKVRDSVEQVLADGPISPSGQQQTDAASIAKNSVGVACEWLRDPDRRPVRF
jgi:hypothetical protein